MWDDVDGEMGWKNGNEVHGTMEDNAMRNATETWEDNNGVTVYMQDNRDGIQGRQ